MAKVGMRWLRHQTVIDQGPRVARGRKCDGHFVVVEDDGRRPAVLECDTCGELLTARLDEPAAASDKSSEWGF